MRKVSGQYLRLAVWALLLALLAACGSKNTQTVTSTVNPSIYYIHSVAFNNGSLYAWGGNTYGQLGNADTTGATQLLPIKVLTAIVGSPILKGVSAGGTHTLAFKNNSSVYAWGNNGSGQLGNGTNLISFFPVKVQLLLPTGSTSPLTNVIGVAAGGSHSLALQSNGTVWAWGDNTNDELGDNTNISRLTAVQVQTPDKLTMTHVTKIAAGGGHSLAISSPSANDNLAYSWGYNGFGQLGLSSNPKAFGSYSTSQNRPFANQVTKAVDGSTLSNVTDIAAGGGHSLFIVNDGVNPATLWACGDNAMGQVGDGTTIIRNRGVVQVKLAGVTGVPVQVAAGLSHSLVLMSNKTVWAWGYNFAGQLGNGAAPSSLAPNPKPQPVSTGPGKPLSNIVKIVAIGNQSFALDNLNQLWVWGDNSFGELGNGSSTSSSYAINIKINNLTTGFDLYHP